MPRWEPLLLGLCIALLAVCYVNLFFAMESTCTIVSTEKVNVEECTLHECKCYDHSDAAAATKNAKCTGDTLGPCICSDACCRIRPPRPTVRSNDALLVTLLNGLATSYECQQYGSEVCQRVCRQVGKYQVTYDFQGKTATKLRNKPNDSCLHVHYF